MPTPTSPSTWSTGVWRDAGHDVHYVQNVTDVDDPLLERAEPRPAWTGASSPTREIELFRDDMAALRVLPPRDYVGVVESIAADRRAVIERLREKGATYEVDGDLYFAVDAPTRVRRRLRLRRETDAGAVRRARRRPRRAGKRHPLDWLLWRARAAGRAGLGLAARAAAGPAGTSSAPRSRWTTSAPASTSRAAAAT